MRKVIVMGLDAASAPLLFERFKGKLPNLERMMEKGAHAALKSSTPPITIPAWRVMMTGKTPGTLGLYGFKHRRNGTYDKNWIADATKLGKDAVWDIVGANGGSSTVVAVPPSYPPYPVKGNLVSCFLIPDTTKDYTYPPELKKEIEATIGEYIPDVEFRTENRDGMLEDLYMMTEKRFDMIKMLITKKKWDFFMFVEIGLDRVQHLFWRYFDEGHHLYEKNPKYNGQLEEYYMFLDKKVGELLALLDNDTVVLAVSDHGAKGMRGAFVINEWLIEQGYLVLKTPPKGIVDPNKLDIDWSKTKAWGWGGYYARVFLNVQGREPQGVIPAADYEKELEILRKKLLAVPDMHGKAMENMVVRPREIYKHVNGDEPDLMCFFGDLTYRSAGTVGHGKKYLLENDTGVDDAVHDWHGIFIIYDPKAESGKRLAEQSIVDIAPTVLDAMGLAIPPEMEGKPIKWR